MLQAKAQTLLEIPSSPRSTAINGESRCPGSGRTAPIVTVYRRSIRRPQSGRVEDRRRNGRHLFRTPDRLSAGGTEPPALCSHSRPTAGSRNGPRPGASSPSGSSRRIDELKGLDCEWLAMEGRCQGLAGGERPAGTRRIVASRGRSGACSRSRRSAGGSGRREGQSPRQKAGRATLEACRWIWPEPTEEGSQGMCMDKGYDYDDTRSCGRSSGSRRTFEPVGKRRRR